MTKIIGAPAQRMSEIVIRDERPIVRDFDGNDALLKD